MISEIKKYCDHLTRDFSSVSSERKLILENISLYISAKIKENKAINLVYICTHNSRRSHFGQVWAQVASDFYNVKNVKTYSGGTEATAFNGNAINALKRIGFRITSNHNLTNPIYRVDFGVIENVIECFSKTYDDLKNPQSEFSAIMTCSDAEANCPFIPGAEIRISTTYNDPKVYDNSPQQDQKYDERCKQIALETMYIFSKISKNKK